jgi:hypothetical protein
MNAPVLCPHCGNGIFVDPDEVQTSWVVCPHCASVVDPAAPVPVRPTLAPAPRVPPRRTDRVGRALAVVAGAVGLALAGYFGWWYYRDHYPEFREHADPGGGYWVSYPVPREADPGRWAGVRRPEFYGVRWEPVSADGRDERVVRHALEEFCRPGRNRYFHLTRTTPRTIHGCPAIDFEIRQDWGVDYTGGRVIGTRDRVYFLLVGGDGLSPTDARARRFFNSFRHRSW